MKITPHQAAKLTGWKMPNLRHSRRHGHICWPDDNHLGLCDVVALGLLRTLRNKRASQDMQRRVIDSFQSADEAHYREQFTNGKKYLCCISDKEPQLARESTVLRNLHESGQPQTVFAVDLEACFAKTEAAVRSLVLKEHGLEQEHGLEVA